MNANPTDPVVKTTQDVEVKTTKKVLEAEVEQILAQRVLRLPELKNRPEAAKELEDDQALSKRLFEEQGAVGLCFSGGGIRSATLNLGILQGLKQTGVLKFVDYLSTVSGGGYIGSWFCAARFRLAQAAQAARKDDTCAKELLEDDAFLIEEAATGRGSPPLRHLRQYARYLAPKAGITSGDVWTMVSLWLRNTLLIQLMVLTALIFIIAALQVLPVVFAWLVLHEETDCWVLPGMLGVQLACVVCAAVCARQHLCIIMKAKQEEVRGAAAARPALVIMSSMAVAAFFGGAQIFRKFAEVWENVGDPPSVWLDPVCWGFASVAAISVVWVMFMTRTAKTEQQHRWWHGLLYVLGGVLTLTAVMMVLIWALAEIFEQVAWMHRVPRDAFADGFRYWTVPALVWSSLLSIPLLLAGYGLAMVLAIGFQGRHSSAAALEWLGRSGAWLAVGIVLSALALGVAVAGPVCVDFLFSDALGTWVKSSVIGAWLAASVGAVMTGKSDKTSSTAKCGPMEALLAWLPLIMLVGLLLALSWVVRWAFIKTLEVVPEGTSGFLMNYFGDFGLGPGFWGSLGMVAGGSCAVALLLIWRVDLNQFSMNPFYRNRLVRCYLGSTRMHHMTETERTPHGATGFDFADDLQMSDLRFDADKVPYQGPLPIINTAANAATSAGLDVQDRSAESFTFTPLHAGFHFARYSMPHDQRDPATAPTHRAYCETERYGAGWTLGQALSVSGAAASPNSGYHTSPLVAFMLTLFNARLGWWAPHPGKEKAGSDRPHGIFGFLGCLINELTGSANLDKDFIYLSDGGHFENLGLYELVRRRCRVIIVGDGECDAIYNFQALGTAIRRCKVDFGVHISIETRDIRPDPATGVSRSHVAFGTIKYPKDHAPYMPDCGDGILIYIKSSMTGDENLAIQQFRGENPLFPHESTGDQFFSESQFESYRELGQHIALQVFRPVSTLAKTDDIMENESFAGWIKWLNRVADFWRPPPRIASTSFISHTETLTEIWRQTLSNPALAGFDEELMPKWSNLVLAAAKRAAQAPSGIATAPATVIDPARHIAYITQEIIQLMENIYLDLDLHHDADHKDHRGWMALFKHWVRQPAIKEAWISSKGLFGERFENFWDDVLAEKPVAAPAPST